jgi:hypothetical protein
VNGELRLCVVCGRDIRHRGDGALYCHRTCKDKAKRRRHRMNKSLAAPLPPTHCVPCDKLACPTEDAARATKRAVEDRSGHTNAVRYYQCPEGWWHWTRVDATLTGFRARNKAAS